MRCGKERERDKRERARGNGREREREREGERESVCVWERECVREYMRESYLRIVETVG